MGTETNLATLFAEYEQNSAIHVLEPGKYKLQVTSCKPRGTGVQPVFKVVEGPETGKRVMAGGIYAGTTEGGANAFFRKLEKFGLGKEFFQSQPSLADVAKALENVIVEVEVGTEVWNDEERNTMGFGITLVERPPLPAVGGLPSVATPPTATPPNATPPPVDQTISTTTTTVVPPTAASEDVGF